MIRTAALLFAFLLAGPALAQTLTLTPPFSIVVAGGAADKPFALLAGDAAATIQWRGDFHATFDPVARRVVFLGNAAVAIKVGDAEPAPSPQPPQSNVTRAALTWRQNRPAEEVAAVRGMYERLGESGLRYNELLAGQRAKPDAVSADSWAAWRAGVAPAIQVEIDANRVITRESLVRLFGEIVEALE